MVRRQVYAVCARLTATGHDVGDLSAAARLSARHTRFNRWIEESV